MDTITDSGDCTVMVAGNVAVSGVPLESVTFRVKLDVPVAVGIPLITPVVGARFRPAGSAPAVIVQEKGDVPPERVGV